MPPLPTQTILRIAIAGILNRRRSLRADSAGALRSGPPVRLEGREHIPPAGPFLVVMNHYNPPGLPIWWPVMAISLALPEAPHWVMTAAWTYPDGLKRWILGPLSGWAFTRVARVYGFTNMPVMPPRPGEETARAAAVRRVLNYARANPAAVIGLAPEGHSTPTQSLAWPPPGSGRFMLGLAQSLGQILPVGVCSQDGQLTVRFGPAFNLAGIPPQPREMADQQAARCVMDHLARLLPPTLRGEF